MKGGTPFEQSKDRKASKAFAKGNSCLLLVASISIKAPSFELNTLSDSKNQSPLPLDEANKPLSEQRCGLAHLDHELASAYCS